MHAAPGQYGRALTATGVVVPGCVCAWAVEEAYTNMIATRAVQLIFIIVVHCIFNLRVAMVALSTDRRVPQAWASKRATQ